MKSLKTINEIIDESLKTELYLQLVLQLNKDFRLANIYFEVAEDITPSQLKLELHETIFRLLQTNFSEYLNLLYIIDVSENQIKQMDGSDTLKLSEEVSYLILKREWQKVWFKNQYK